MTEAYKVGITIALTNQISRGLMLIQGDLAKTDAQAKKLHATLKEIKLLGIGGAILGGAGFAGLHAIGRTLDAAKEYQQALAQFKSLNLGDAINSQADKFARGSQVIGASATDLMKTTKELHTILNDFGESKMLAPLVAQMQFANASIGGTKGAGAFNENQRQMLGKVLEYRGGFASTDAMKVQSDYLQHVMSGTGYMVMPRDYRNFLARGGIAAQQMSNDAFYYKSEPLVQMIGGSALGVAMNTAYGRLVFGNGAGSPGGKAFIELLDQLGLVRKDHIEHNRITGKITKVQADYLKDSDLFKSDPYAFLKERVVPAMRAMGFDERAIESGIKQVYGRTGGDAMIRYHAQYIAGKAQGKAATDAKAMGVDEIINQAKKTPQGTELALGKAWENLKIAMGESLWPVIIPGLNKLAEGLRDLGRWINRHPIRFEWLVAGFTSLSAALLIGGSVLALTAALKALGLVIGLGVGVGAVAGVVAFTAAIAGLSAVIGQSGLAKVGSFTDNVGASPYNPLNMIQKGAAWAVHGMNWSGVNNGGITPPPARGQGGQQPVVLKMDGRVVGEITAQRLGDTGRSPLASTSGFDGRLHPQWGF